MFPESSNSGALFKKPSTTAIARKPKKPKILTEEKYTEEVSKIIQRDFFPDLVKLRAQNAYIEAESRQDYATMASIRAKYTGPLPKTSRTTNNVSPATFETPVNTRNVTPCPNEATSKASSENKDTTKLSLDAFLQNYTSEDNHSFQEIIETTHTKLRQKFAVFYTQEEIAAEQLKRSLTLPSIEAQFQAPDPMRKIESWNYTNRNSLMYVPDAANSTAEDRLRAAEYNQRIQHSATRLLNTLQQQGTKDNTLSNSSIDEQRGDSQPKIKGYELLTSPRPCFESFSPIMTWGEIEGTPMQINCGDTPLRITDGGPSFRIRENSRRENIALSLADKVGVKMRAQKQQALCAARKSIGSPFVGSKLDRLASMSPAAQRLATSKLGLRKSTPVTPSSLTSIHKRRSQVANNTSASIKSATKVRRDNTEDKSSPPKTCVTTVNQQNIDTGSTITDGLLQLPLRRQK